MKFTGKILVYDLEIETLIQLLRFSHQEIERSP